MSVEQKIRESANNAYKLCKEHKQDELMLTWYLGYLACALEAGILKQEEIEKALNKLN